MPAVMRALDVEPFMFLFCIKPETEPELRRLTRVMRQCGSRLHAFIIAGLLVVYIYVFSAKHDAVAVSCSKVAT